MADTFTTNLNLTKPEVGASDDSWGTKLNSDLDTIDGLFDSGPVLKVAKGGTGAATASGARTALGLGDAATGDIGTDVQAYDATLTSLASLGTAADKLAYTTGVDTWAETGITSFGRSLIDDADAAAARTTLGLGDAATGTIGSTVQGYDADTLKADTADQLTAAFTAAVDDDGTKSSGTYTPSVASGSNYKKIVNGGAFTLAPPTLATNEAVTLSLFIANGGSSGAITTSGFNSVTGDSFTTTSTDEFLCRIEVFDIGGTEYSHLDVVALQ